LEQEEQRMNEECVNLPNVVIHFLGPKVDIFGFQIRKKTSKDHPYIIPVYIRCRARMAHWIR